MLPARTKVVDLANSWIGINEKDGSFQPLFNIYNSIDPLPSNYTLKYTDPWNAGLISAIYQQSGYADMFPCESSNAKIIDRAKQMGLWFDYCGYMPNLADVILFDFDEDNKDVPSDIGIVVETNDKGRAFVVLTCRDAQVRKLTLSASGNQIRGYILPRFPDACDDITHRTTVVNIPKSSIYNEIEKPQVQQEEEIVIPLQRSIETVGTGVLSRMVVGQKLRLINVPLYASATTKKYSSLKSGVYYLWSVDTVNGKVRITNSSKHAGVIGQVTGWILAEDAIKYSTRITTESNTILPNFQPSAVYIVQVDELPIYKGPGTAYDRCKYEDLTPNAKKYDVNHNGCICKHAKVTCLDTQVIGNNVWVQIPSGWVQAYVNNTYHIK